MADNSGKSARSVAGGTERRVGRFEIVSDIAETAFGSLSLARIALGDEQGRTVLLRRIERQPALDDPALRRIKDACQTVTKVRHASVVGMLEVRLGTSLVVADEYVEGEPLCALMRQAFEQKRPFGARVALRLALDTILSALAAKRALVDANVVRSLSGLTPDCLLVASFGEVMIADLGLATLEQAPRIPELVAYRCPVQLGSHTPGNERTEVYSVGVMLWELLSNQPLFAGGGEDEVRQRILTGAPEPPTELDPSLRELLRKAVNRSPLQRFEGLEAMARAIRDLGPGMLATHEELARVLDERCHDKLESRRLLIEVASDDEEADDGRISWRPTFKPVAPGQPGGLVSFIELPRGPPPPPPNPELESIDFEVDEGLATVPMTPVALATQAALARSKPSDSSSLAKAPNGRSASPAADPSGAAPSPAKASAATPEPARSGQGAGASDRAAEPARPVKSLAPVARAAEPLRPAGSPVPPAVRPSTVPAGAKDPARPSKSAPAKASQPPGPAARASERVRSGKSPLPGPKGESVESSERLPPGSKAAEPARGGARDTTPAERVSAAPAPNRSSLTSSPAPRPSTKPATFSTPPPSSRPMSVEPGASGTAARQGARSEGIGPDLPKSRAPMASSDGLEKYAIALADPTSPVERARVEQVDQTVIVNDGSTPAAPPRSTEPAGDAANAAAGGADGIEWQPADSKSPTLPPSRISRNAPAPAVPAEAQAILGALAPAEEERPHETASSGRRRLYFGLGLGAVLMAGAVTLLVARSGDTTEPGRRAEPPRAASETAPPPRPPARQPDEGRAPEAPVPAASSSAPAPSPAPPPEPSPLVKPKRIPAKPPARPAARSPAGEAPPPPPPGDDNPY